MNEVGISTNCVMDLPLERALTILEPLTHLVEIQCDANHSLFRHASVLDKFDLRYTIHAPTADGNIAESFEPIRKASIAVIKETAEIADLVGAKKLVIHPGFCLDPTCRKASVSALHRSIQELGDLQEEFSVRFVMENLGSMDCCFFQNTELIQDLRAAGLGLALDVGHANLTGTLDAFLKEKPDHFHLHDNKGMCDEHAACGTGIVDFGKILPEIGDATLILEVLKLKDVKPSLEYLTSLGY
ncbi:Xylose isomerase domain protein TIM barrel [Methanocorpusculum labreanum Z]|uniref:Xylose isomerase domain protein TIM barrel n=1 Tax=Methanocorpusculum labreanum (strain ATCC 43576 / DSM 4855 / Z) TaxID=410358 RepID=A2ST89_METLZ|nr:sugar phosphate isomerase/epimerase family protein [Methanocorpusculum labreanum]ABN07545.1 Xylose isomerase domain protein TIM barrel [Methanocorpusculum labreanum Z]